MPNAKNKIIYFLTNCKMLKGPQVSPTELEDGPKCHEGLGDSKDFD